MRLEEGASYHKCYYCAGKVCIEHCRDKTGFYGWFGYKVCKICSDKRTKTDSPAVEEPDTSTIINTEFVNDEIKIVDEPVVNTEQEKTESVNTEPEKTEHEKTESVNTESEKTEPEKTESVNMESEKTEPEKVESPPALIEEANVVPLVEEIKAVPTLRRIYHRKHKQDAERNEYLNEKKNENRAIETPAKKQCPPQNERPQHKRHFSPRNIDNVPIVQLTNSIFNMSFKRISNDDWRTGNSP
jgi:hypothetical protein